MTQTAILFHINGRYNYCADGIGSLWMCLRHVGFRSSMVGNQKHLLRDTLAVGVTPPEASSVHTLMSVLRSFRESHPEGGDLTVYYVDCCPAYTVSELVVALKEFGWSDAHNTLTLDVTDHHATNEAAGQRLMDGIRELSSPAIKGHFNFGHRVSASMLMRDRLAPETVSFKEGLGVIDYLNDYDVWIKELPSCEEVSAYVATIVGQHVCFDGTKEWMEALYMSMDRLDLELRREGVYVATNGDATPFPMLAPSIRAFAVTALALQGLYVLRAMEEAVYYTTDGDDPVKIGLVFADSHRNEISDKMINENGCAAAFVIHPMGDGSYKVSGRSKAPGSNFNVAEVAKLYGGGGHRSAAGFTMPNATTVHFAPGNRLDKAMAMYALCFDVNNLHAKGKLS